MIYNWSVGYGDPIIIFPFTYLFDFFIIFLVYTSTSIKEIFPYRNQTESIRFSLSPLNFIASILFLFFVFLTYLMTCPDEDVEKTRPHLSSNRVRIFPPVSSLLTSSTVPAGSLTGGNSSTLQSGFSSTQGLGYSSDISQQVNTLESNSSHLSSGEKPLCFPLRDLICVRGSTFDYLCISLFICLFVILFIYLPIYILCVCARMRECVALCVWKGGVVCMYVCACVFAYL